MPLRGRGGRASWPPAAAEVAENKGSGKFSVWTSPAVEHADVRADGCRGPGGSEDSAGGSVAGQEPGQRDRQHEGQGDSAGPDVGHFLTPRRGIAQLPPQPLEIRAFRPFQLL